MESASADWTIELFGGLRAVCKDRSVVRFRTQRGGLLLSILAARPERVHSRDELGELLWPDEDPQRQRLRLRGELSELRTGLGDDIFERSGNVGVRVRPGVTSDVARFEGFLLAAVRASAPEQRLPPLQAAASLYRGDLLPGFFDDWSVREREHLRAGCFTVLTRLTLDLELLGRTDEARLLRRDLADRFPEEALPPAPRPAPPSGDSAADGYYGREADLDAVKTWASLSSHAGRLLTLMGPGGMGKTRLARQALPEATFVALAEVSDGGAGFFDALQSALGLSEGEAPTRERVIAALRERSAPLLILDNFEQLVERGAGQVEALLRDVSGLRCVVTSRRRLGIPGERTRALEPLPHAPSVALFLDRARRARPDFAQNPSSLPVVEEIVALLEGLPLALELAAARSVVLGPVQMREQLSARLRFLVNRRDAPTERHRSLRIALDWSIHLLSPELAGLFARLSVFRGGWSLEAAAAVCEGLGIVALDALDDLHAHSLISVRFDEDETPRYDMLTVVREYAEELLERSGEREGARLAHARFFQDEAQAISADYRSGDSAGAHRALRPDLDNYRRLIHLSARESEALFFFLDRLGGPLFELGYWSDLESWLGAIDISDLDKEKKHRILGLKGAFFRRKGDEERASAAWNARLEITREIAAPDPLATELFDLAAQALDRGDVGGAAVLLSEGRQLAQEHDLHDRRVVGTTLEARRLALEDDTEGALQAAEDAWSLLLSREFSDSLLCYVAVHLLSVFRRGGRAERCEALSERGIALALENSLLFHLARLMDEAGLCCDADGERARLASWAASRLHRQLKSRFSPLAERRWRELAENMTDEEKLRWQDIPWEASVKRYREL